MTVSETLGQARNLLDELQPPAFFAEQLGRSLDQIEAAVAPARADILEAVTLLGSSWPRTTPANRAEQKLKHALALLDGGMA